MDELDLLKKDWKKQEASLPKYKMDDLHSMLHKKSSSMVKWIFYISILEFVFWIGLSLFMFIFDKDNPVYNPEFKVYNWISNILFYTVIAWFIFKFYKNYKRIHSDDSVKGLMHNILKTKRTVKYYVWFNLLFFAITFPIVSYLLFKNDAFDVPANTPDYVIWLSLSITAAVVLLVLIIFYRLLYGILTRRLRKNYKELEDMNF